MTYSRPLKPKFFPDNINAMKLHGQAKSTTLTHRVGSYNTGYDIYDLFDLQPFNVTSLDTGSSATHILIGIDLGTSAFDTDYFLLMNHNLFTAEATIRVAHDTSAITAVGGGTTVAVSSSTVVLNGEAEPDTGETINATINDSQTNITVTDATKFTVGELIRVSGGSGNETMKVTVVSHPTLTCTRAQQGSSATEFEAGDSIRRYRCVSPLADGDTLFSFTSSSDRYWAIEIIPNDGLFSATDITMGAALLGEAYTMPLAPDIMVPHTFNMSGVSVATGTSGKRFSSPAWVKANASTAAAGNYIPFRSGIGAQQIPGREGYSFSFQYIADTNLLPENLGAPSGNNFAVNVFAKTGWQAMPFAMTIDSASTSAGDFMFCRLVGDSYSITQQAYQVYSMGFSVDQEF